MKVVSVAEMRRIDELAQTRHGIDAFSLMSEAGRSIAETFDTTYKPEAICVVCGRGNNAGDGFVAARVLHEMGRNVTVVCLEPATSYTGAARKAWELLCETKTAIVTRFELSSCLQKAEIVVDALLGTGTTGPARGEYGAVIRELNSSGKQIVSADVPSGLRELKPNDEMGDVINATMTLTIGLPKRMLLTLPGSGFAGRVVALPINFPQALLESDEWTLNLATESDMANWLPERRLDSNKGTYGSVGLIGSAVSYAGATVLTARGALRAGCGLATIYSLAETNVIYKTALPEATSIILDGGKYGYYDIQAGKSFATGHTDHTVLTMGPGLGLTPETKVFFRHVMSAWSEPLILDADALNILSEGMLDCLAGREECLLTPHPGEMARLLGISIKEVQADRLTVVRNFALAHQVTVLLKGAGTLVARPNGQTWLVRGAEPALAKGGTGDVLTGVIASLYAQGMPLWQAAVLGASAHLAAGSRCSSQFGSRGVLASDVADAIPLVLDTFQKTG